MDGQSTDNTMEILEKYKKHNLFIISKKDDGMYDALAKGFRLCQGEIISYLNAGDFYSLRAFDVLLDLFGNNNKIHWLTGLKVIYNLNSSMTSASVPFNYRKRFFEKGLYGRYLPFVQQESTFYSKYLLEKIDLDELAKFKLAGDYYLWKTFSNFKSLHIVSAYLGGFKIHPNQLSSNLDLYFHEVKRITRTPNVFDYLLSTLDKILWNSPLKIKKVFNPNNLLFFNHKTGNWD